MPVVDSLICFLSGLGYDFRHLQAALEEVMAVQDDPAVQLAGRLRSDPALRPEVAYLDRSYLRRSRQARRCRCRHP